MKEGKVPWFFPLTGTRTFYIFVVESLTVTSSLGLPASEKDFVGDFHPALFACDDQRRRHVFLPRFATSLPLPSFRPENTRCIDAVPIPSEIA